MAGDIMHYTLMLWLVLGAPLSAKLPHMQIARGARCLFRTLTRRFLRRAAPASRASAPTPASAARSPETAPTAATVAINEIRKVRCDVSGLRPCMPVLASALKPAGFLMRCRAWLCSRGRADAA